MMKKLVNHSLIKIPEGIIFYFCKKQNFLILKGKLGIKIIELKTKILFSGTKESFYVTKEPLNLNSRIKDKDKKAIQTKTISLIRKSLFNISRKSYKRLKLHGVGFKLAITKFKNLKKIVKLQHVFHQNSR